MVECDFAAYFDRQNVDKRIVIHEVTCPHHKSHEANDDEWFYDITYPSIRRFVELIVECRDLEVHNCLVCKPQLTTPT